MRGIKNLQRNEKTHLLLNLSTHVLLLNLGLVQDFNSNWLLGFSVQGILNPETHRIMRQHNHKYNTAMRDMRVHQGVEQCVTHLPKVPSPRVSLSSYFPTRLGMVKEGYEAMNGTVNRVRLREENGNEMNLKSDREGGKAVLLRAEREEGREGR